MTLTAPSRRTVLQRRRLRLTAAGLGATAASWDRLSASDIPGRDGSTLTVAVLGSAIDPSQQSVPSRTSSGCTGIRVRLLAVQATDWNDFFSKILTLIAAAAPPTWSTSRPRECSCSRSGSASPSTPGAARRRRAARVVSPTSIPRSSSR
ncbi:hypothetical protein [Streptomyces sp. KL116D]|uniref:hypothetical protein n=1 Tax=Streptomyces sp. KL116D TaxID=3045152 RepID=UPI003555FDD7